MHMFRSYFFPTRPGGRKKDDPFFCKEPELFERKKAGACFLQPAIVQ
jgi:hypothetical protein